MTLILYGTAIQAGLSGLLDGLGIIDVSAGQQILALIIYAMLAIFYEAGKKHKDRTNDE